MKVTVIVCTYNRCESLRSMLETLMRSTMPVSVPWDVLIIDNNSKDRTRAVVEEFIRLHPGRIRYIFEGKQGKSNALNTGIRESEGDVLAFVDDDVTVDPAWLDKITAPMMDEDWSGSGGKILPEQGFAPPEWLPVANRLALAPFALFAPRPDGGELADPPYGTNMAFRKTMFQKYGVFRTDLGPRPGTEIRSEDTELGKRLLDGGEKLFYEPAAVVHHKVPEDRLTKRYHLKWWYAKGRADVLEAGAPPNVMCFLGVPLFVYRRVVVWSVRSVVAVGAKERFNCQWRLWATLGLMVEGFSQWRKLAKKEEHCSA